MERKKTPKTKVIFDFDHTLFSTKKFYQTLKKEFRKIGISEELFQKTLQEAKGQKGLYSPALQFKLIIKQKPEINLDEIRQEFQKIFNNLNQFLYNDTLSFLKWARARYNLHILSYGEPKLQETKIRKSKIGKFFKKILITKDTDKISALKKILTADERAVFVEDNPCALSKAEKNFQRIITIRINRGEGKYYQERDDENTDFSIKNLKELKKILEKASKKAKALVLFSGGLDSILAAKILMEQGVKVKGITFKSYFFDEKQAKEAAQKIKLPLKIVDFSKEHLKIIKNPKYGYGKAMNPCIDCHILMLKLAKKVMEKERFDFIATGEVLGERPMSQNKEALKLIERESSLTDYLIRPLSARLLKPTIPERMGWLEREKLLNISGRSRQKQIALTKKYKIKEYPMPAGGCLLTDLEFSKRFEHLLKIYPRCDGSDIKLLKIGRHFCFARRSPEDKGGVKIIVGRKKEENRTIKKLTKKRDVLIEMENYPGPLTLVRSYGKGKITSSVLAEAKKLTQHYSTKARDKKDVRLNIEKIN